MVECVVAKARLLAERAHHPAGTSLEVAHEPPF
jgi:hypothetical protein